jgi:hypothetical protein
MGKTAGQDRVAIIAGDAADLLVIDGPARASAGTLELARQSDLVVQPSGCGLDDLRPAVLLFHELLAAGIPRERLRNVERELSEAESAAQRGVAGDAIQIEAAIEAVFAKPVVAGERVRGTVGSVSARCARLDPRTAEDCHRVAKLRADLAAAAEASRRIARIFELRTQAQQLRERGASEAADPVAELFAWLSRGLLSVRDVGFGFPVAFALLIELVSAFGPLGIATYAAATRTPGAAAMAAAASLAAQQRGRPQIEHQAASSVVDFVADETVPAPETSAIGSDELHAAYERWCREKGSRALDRDGFTGEFDRLRELPALRGKIRKFGMRYFGIALGREARTSLRRA